MRRKLAVVVVALLWLAASASSNTLAVFSDTEPVGGNSFTTSAALDLTTTPTTAIVTVASGMLPGDTATGLVTVRNNATVPLRYAMSASATNADSKSLRDQLTMIIRVADAGPACGSFAGTQLYSGALLGTAGKVLGDSTQGYQAGDRPGPNAAASIAAAGTDPLCVRVTLPASTGNGFAGATTTVTFTFDAEQVANNP